MTDPTEVRAAEDSAPHFDDERPSTAWSAHPAGLTPGQLEAARRVARAHADRLQARMRSRNPEAPREPPR